MVSSAAARSIVALLGVVVLSAVLGRRLRWTFPRVLLVSLAAQPLLHALFTAGGHSGDPLHDAHAHHHMATALPMPVIRRCQSSTPRSRLLRALVIRWGLRWLRSMPELVRAVALRHAPRGSRAARPADGAGADAGARRWAAGDADLDLPGTAGLT